MIPVCLTASMLPAPSGRPAHSQAVRIARALPARRFVKCFSLSQTLGCCPLLGMSLGRHAPRARPWPQAELCGPKVSEIISCCSPQGTRALLCGEPTKKGAWQEEGR